MEALFVLPIFSLITLGLVAISDLIVAEQLLSEASARGARTAALGGTEDQIREAVFSVLGPARSQYATIYVTPVTNCGDNSHNQQRGESPDAVPVSPSSGNNPPGGWKCRPGQLVEVRVEVDVGHATVLSFCPVCPSEKLVGCSVTQCE